MANVRGRPFPARSFVMSFHVPSFLDARSFRLPALCRAPLFVIFSLLVLSCGRASRGEDRSIDGSGNNLLNLTWGSAGTDYSRESSGAHYQDGIFAPVAAGLPSARLIS